MEDLKTILENNMSIVDINDKVNRFVDSAKDYDDKLKLTFVALNLIQKASELAHSIDSNAFITQIKDRIGDIEKQAKIISEEYGTHLIQNDIIIDALINKDDQQINDIKHQIKDLLSTYDSVIKTLVEERERLSLIEVSQKQPNKEK